MGLHGLDDRFVGLLLMDLSGFDQFGWLISPNTDLFVCCAGYYAQRALHVRLQAGGR